MRRAPQGVTLINGQHRLWAIVESGIAVEMTVWWGCEPEEFNVIDQGAPRTMGDVLATTRSDLSDPTLLASVCSAVCCYAFSGPVSRMTSQQVAAMIDKFQGELLAVVDYKKRLRKMAPRSVLSTLFLAQLIDPMATELIVSQMKDAVGFTERCPIRALHLYLSDCTMTGHRDTPDTMHYKICNAIALRLQGEHVKHLRLTGDGLGWLRETARPRIGSMVSEFYGGRVPNGFYLPRPAGTEGRRAA